MRIIINTCNKFVICIDDAKDGVKLKFSKGNIYQLCSVVLYRLKVFCQHMSTQKHF
jgi:hypothetical protein